MLHFFWDGQPLAQNSFEKYEFSNREIAKWAEYYLSQKTAFHQSSWHVGKVTENPSDILLGHLTWDARPPHIREVMGELVHDWAKDNALAPSQPSHPNTYVLTPWVPEFPDVWMKNMVFCERQLMAASKIFALCGEIWIRRTLEDISPSIQHRVKDKLVHCNMGVASQNFRVTKQHFNPIGERQILHVSNLRPYKGFDVTCSSLVGLDTLLHVATSSIQANPGLIDLTINDQVYVMNYLGFVDNNNPEFNHWVVENCDFYIHTGRMDAQATTILENGARGLIPLVTPESGFASPHAIYLTHDPDENRAIIQQALEMSEEELMKRSHLIREQIAREHNWEGIFNRIWREISADIEERSRSIPPV
jgi:glycosyltransferase involved in cell wall biosynthesis